MNVNFDELSDNDIVSWVDKVGSEIKAFYVDFRTNNKFVISLYIEDNLAKCVSSSCLPFYAWVEYVETLARVYRFIQSNGFSDLENSKLKRK